MEPELCIEATGVRTTCRLTNGHVLYRTPKGKRLSETYSMLRAASIIPQNVLSGNIRKLWLTVAHVEKIVHTLCTNYHRKLGAKTARATTMAAAKTVFTMPIMLFA